MGGMGPAAAKAPCLRPPRPPSLSQPPVAMVGTWGQTVARVRWWTQGAPQWADVLGAPSVQESRGSSSSLSGYGTQARFGSVWAGSPVRSPKSIHWPCPWAGPHL